MIGPVALTLIATMAQTSAPALTDFQAEINALLLDGLPLPPDYPHRLRAMPPAQRIEALIYLRRTGMLTGRVWPLVDLLAPAIPETRDMEGPK